METEEQVVAVTDKMSARAERNLNKATMDIQKNQYLTTGSRRNNSIGGTDKLGNRDRFGN